MVAELHRVVARAPGGGEQLTSVNVPMPNPGDNQVLVAVEACGVNFIDIYHRTGLYPMPLPIPLGLEGAGRVLRAGKDAGIAEGSRVAWCQVPGSYASHVVAPASAVVPVPDGIDSQTAAAAMLQGLTAHYLVKGCVTLGPGMTALVHAAAGGVGLILCQLGKKLGARVIGTVSTPEKAALAKAAGASDVILYTQQDFVAEVKRLTDGKGVDVSYDSVGKTTFEGSLSCLKPRGMLVLFGQSSGSVPPFDIQLLNKGGSLFVTRPKLGDYTATRAEYEARVADLWLWIRESGLKISIDSTFPLSKAAQAHARLESRATSGKVLLIP